MSIEFSCINLDFKKVSGSETLLGIEVMNALPDMSFSDEAAMRLAGFNAVQIRQGICQWSHEKRQGAKPPGSLYPDTWTDNIVKLSLFIHDWYGVFPCRGIHLAARG